MFRGSIVALVTPMKDGVGPEVPLDWTALERLIEHHIESGTDAIVAVGTTGESATLNEKEHCEVIRRTVEIVRRRIPVIAGTGANSTTEAVNLTHCAKEVGADACLLVTPYYNKPTQEGLYQHYRHVAETVEIPQILYNVPGRTACDMLPETVARLGKLRNIIGIKEASADLDRVGRIREACGDDFMLVSGEDGSAREFIQRGGDGVISVTANVAPAAMHRMCACALSGDGDEAERIDATLQDLHRALFLESNPIPAKWAVHKLGLIENGIRLPLTWFSEKYVPELEAAMRTAGVI